MRMLIGYRAVADFGKFTVASWPKSVPFDMLNEEWAQRNHGQSLARLNERGGLCPSEMLANIERRRFQRMDENVAAVRIASLIAARGDGN